MTFSSFVFPETTKKQIDAMPTEMKLKFYETVTNYGMYGIEPENLTQIENLIWIPMKDLIDNSRAKRGAPVGNNNAQKQNKQSENNKNNSENEKTIDLIDFEEKQINQSENNYSNLINVNDNGNDNQNVNQNDNHKDKKPPKHRYGEFANVLLTDEELHKLQTDYGEKQTDAAIQYLSEYIARKGCKDKSHYLTLRKWVFKALQEQPKYTSPPTHYGNFEPKLTLGGCE